MCSDEYFERKPFSASAESREEGNHFPMSSGVKKNLPLYVVAFGIAALVPFLLLPVLTRVLSPAEFGTITAFLIVCLILSNISGITSHSFVAVRFFKKGSSDLPIAISASIVTIMIAHISFGTMVFFADSMFPSWLGLSNESLLLAIFTSLFLSANLIFLVTFQSTQNASLYLKLRALQGFVELTGCLLLVGLVSIGPDARIFPYSLAIFLSALLGFSYCKSRAWVGLAIDKAAVIALLKFGIPLIPHVIAGTSITYVDRVLVSSNLGLAALGIYMVAVQLGMAILAIIDPLNKAFTPWLFERISSDNAAEKKDVVKKTYQLIFILCVIGIIYSSMVKLFADFLIGAQFRAAIDLVPFIVAGFVMQGVYYTQVNYIIYSERTGLLSIATVCVACFGFLSSYYYISHFGLEGAAFAFFINNFALALVIWCLSAKLVNMPWLGRSVNEV